MCKGCEKMDFSKIGKNKRVFEVLVDGQLKAVGDYASAKQLEEQYSAIFPKSKIEVREA